ncbi:hypothetical protein OWR28_17905 [Chryseobacterium sp. 1B4]
MDSRLKIIAGFKGGESYMKDLYVSLPFRVVSVGQRKNDKKLYQMVMSSSREFWMETTTIWKLLLKKEPHFSCSRNPIRGFST